MELITGPGRIAELQQSEAEPPSIATPEVGKPWTEFNKDKETITLKGLTGTVAVTAQY